MAERLQVNPTRMQLMQLRKRLGVAVHGHSLLKDKLEGLMAEFMELIDDYKEMRREFDQQYPDVARLFVLAGIAGSRDAVEDAINQGKSELEITETQRNVLSLQVPHFEVSVKQGGGYSLFEAPLELDEAVGSMAEYLPKILELAETEHSLWLMMKEIESTRRRVNALEYIMIPRLRNTAKYIQSKLDENERSNITRLMKIKDMRLEEERQERLKKRGER